MFLVGCEIGRACTTASTEVRRPLGTCWYVCAIVSIATPSDHSCQLLSRSQGSAESQEPPLLITDFEANSVISFCIRKEVKSVTS